MILVVGGAGYLGSHVTELLRDRCVVYDNLSYCDEYLLDIPFVNGDVTDYDKLGYWLKEASTVVWLAAIVGDAACSISPSRAISINVDAVKFLAENFIGNIIFASTASVYGTGEGMSGEESPLRPQSLYAETKIRAEQALVGKSALILRLGTMHGLSPRMRFDLVVNAMARDAIMKGTITVFGGDQKRPLIHVADVAEYIRMWCGGYEPGTYNFTTENVSINDIAIRVMEATGAEIAYKDSEFEDKRDYSLACDKLIDTFHPCSSPKKLEASVGEIASALNEGRIKDPYSEKYMNMRRMQR